MPRFFNVNILNDDVTAKKLRKILVPFDGSKNSFRGLDVAISIAKKAKSSITLFHCIYAPPHSEFRAVEDVEKRLKKEVNQFMEKAEKAVSKEGIKVQRKVTRGDVGYNIIKYAHSKNGNFDIVVIGSRGRGAVKSMFFGSVSNYVLHSSKIPVLVVK